MATSQPPFFDATEFFSLQDIALWSTSLRRDVDYQPALHDGKTIIQSMKSTKPEIISADTADQLGGESHDLLRAFVKLGVRSVFRDGDDAADAVLYTLEATYAVDYLILKVPESEDFTRFVDMNCLHNAWPFWRQHVYDTLKRASLPVPVVPLFSGKGSKKRTKTSRAAKKLPV